MSGSFFGLRRIVAMRWIVRIAVSVGSCLLSLSQVDACTTPVYRYALERWEGGVFPVYFFRGRVFEGRDQAWVAAAEKSNMRLQVIDVTQRPFAEGVEVYERYAKGNPLPFVVGFGVEGLANGTKRRWGQRENQKESGQEPVVMGSVANGHEVATMPNSPARQKIAEHILAGGVAAWVVVKGGDAKKDGEFADELRRLLADAQKSVVDPAIEAERIRKQWGELANFLVMELDRGDVMESFFVRQLLEDRVGKMGEGEPLVYPIFGRGRALPPLGRKDLDTKTVKGWAEYLTGDCSCEIKAQNPGRDLIFPDVWADGIQSPMEG